MPPDETVPDSAGSLGGRGPVAFARQDAATVDELHSLLRRRVRFACLLFAGYYTYSLAALLYRYANKDHLSGLHAIYIANIAMVPLAALALAWLCRAAGTSLRRLRAIECGLFGVLLVSNVVRAALYTHTYPLWQLGLEWVHTGQDKLAADSIQAMTCQFYVPWVLLILGYGVLIPNQARRCALIVGVFAVAAVICWSTVAIVDGVFAAFWLEICAYALRMLVVPALVAVYTSYRIEHYRQQALEARKLGQYQLVRRLGGGAMGEVYLAEHILLRRPCAVKLIRRERAGDARTLVRFEREVQLTAALTHPNTIQIYDYGRTDDGTFYYAMEYLPGPTLDELVARHGALPPARAIHLLRQICGALHEAHGAGLIHRDIKPSNVIVCQRGGLADVAKLLDFGLVRRRVAGSEDTTLTQEGAITGTPAYMSPEQAAGHQDLDGRSDIYSVGALAYFLITGRPPFAGRRMMETLAAHMYEAPVPPSSQRDGVPAELDALVLRCLAKKPADRFPDPRALDLALAACRDAGRWTEGEADAWWRTIAPKGES